jgi:hypothetical protein
MVRTRQIADRPGPAHVSRGDLQKLSRRPDTRETDVLTAEGLPLPSGHRERQHGVGLVAPLLLSGTVFRVGQRPCDLQRRGVVMPSASQGVFAVKAREDQVQSSLAHLSATSLALIPTAATTLDRYGHPLSEDLGGLVSALREVFEAAAVSLL